MILTVTLNTSIDKAYRVSEPVVTGTVMRVTSCEDFAGGKGLNASRAVRTCGERVVATGFVGGNNGRLLCELLAADGVEEDFVHVMPETRCCINVLEPDGRSTEFLEPGRPVPARDMDNLMGKLSDLAPQADVVTINGSIPQGLPRDTYAHLVRTVRGLGTPCILDTSGDLLANAIPACPDMVKPNTDEIGQLLGHEVNGMEEVVAAARELHGRGVGTVVVSLGGDGAVMACDEGTFRGRSPRIEVVNPVGSGDTMVGAFAVATARGLAAPERLRYAMACATANCLTASTGHFDIKAAEELLADTTVERLD